MRNISKTLILPRYIIWDQATGDNVCYISDIWKGKYVRIIATRTTIISDQRFSFLKGFSKIDYLTIEILPNGNERGIQGMLRECEVSYFLFCCLSIFLPFIHHKHRTLLHRDLMHADSVVLLSK